MTTLDQATPMAPNNTEAIIINVSDIKIVGMITEIKKGFHIFGKAITKILNKFNKWKAYAIGNERRETHNFTHKNFKVIDWLPHEKILNFYNVNNS